ncbi:LLM class F420-dependent oxidoreductase [Nocardioides sp. cx-169]|uniref:LLM class F420-dependent oxidoreductase n=1 Tax=Nocardioides sp. cx-169 TaxID=2899080 RepID=UPI001E4AEED7|nr:LLM class F420-dependent oxidoreductase [Nocardioides sp. cx-169]MCD4532895.1 LLM class F420-dependent oxidoreductase [Nocardioides sp. cx-169]
MRLGLTSPVVTALPGFNSAWERAAGIAELTRIAEAADRLGFDHLTCSEHVAVPIEVAEQRGGTYWDPLATLSYLAARTSRIRLVTQVLVLGYHHPLEVAKRYGTLDLVSGGRLVLGVGVGSVEEEFALVGADFPARGAVADDAMRALRGSLGQRFPEYDGPHFSYSGLVVEPHAVQDRVPLWVGGYTPRSLRRAVTLGDGWMPFGLDHDRLREMLAATDLPAGFEVVLGAGRPIDPIGEPDRTRRALDRTRAAGATLVTVHVAATSADHYVEQLEALARLEEDQ